MKTMLKESQRSSSTSLSIVANQSNYISQWWNQRFAHQKRLEISLEHVLFHLVITLLVIIQCTTIIIEILFYNIKHQYECNVPPYSSNDYIYKKTYHLQYGLEICHYTSLCILSFFIFELILKIYALGFHYWSSKENHILDYFDAFLIIFSFAVEIYFCIVDKESIIVHSTILIIVLRLWHLLRITNVIIRYFQKGQEFKTIRQRRHSERYAEAILLIPSSIQIILDLMQEKTEYLRYDICIEQSLITRFENIDRKCQDAFDNYYGNEMKLVSEIQKLHLIPRRRKYKKNHSVAV
ncbi:unnamed protein product [Adineta steineri]|uniref:Voltage-gated hydrogen channel 1 n=1 Tax=Adineta steineri TaxID=433720 RepID=A0A813RHB6_9BILA|nr:unnamed protein product [Adineta steineri]